MGWFKQLCLSWIILSAAAVSGSCQELTSTLREGNRTCRGEEVIFTCTIRGSSTLSVLGVAWSSPEYIGQDGSLQLSTADMIGAVQTSTSMDGNITATATVTNNTNVNGELVLETTLRITAIVNSTVICRDPNRGPASIEFTVSVIPGVPMDITASEISRSFESNICVILVTWAPPTNSDTSDIAQYRLHVPSRNVVVTVSSTPPPVSTLRVPNCGDDIRVQVAAVNSIGCVGMNSPEVKPILADIPTVSTDDRSNTTEDGSATTEGGSTSTSSQLGVGAVVGIAIGVILPTLFFLSLIFICIYCVCVAGKYEKVEVVYHEMSMIRQGELQKNLVDFYRTFKKDLPEEVKLSSVESLYHMMDNRTLLSKLYIKEAVKIALKTINLEDGEDVKNVLIYLKKNVPRAMSSFDEELEDKGTGITMANLIRAAEQNEHARDFDKLMEIMDNTKPEIVEGLLQTMFEELQIHLQPRASSVEMEQVTNLPGGEVNMESPTS